MTRHLPEAPRRLVVCFVALVVLASALVFTHGSADAAPGNPRGCHDAVNFLWPARSRYWAHRIVQRESGGFPGAQNRRSTAAGCFQMLAIHAGRYRKYGFSWADRYNPIINTFVAMDLYREQGARPWR